MVSTAKPPAKKRRTRGKTKKAAPAAKKPATPRKSGSDFVESQAQLAKALDCSRSTINRLLKRDGCPGSTPDGRYHVEQWREFYTKNQEPTHAELESAKRNRIKTRLEEIKLENAELELKLDRGDVIGVDDAIEVVGNMLTEMLQYLRDADQTTAPDVVGMSVPQATKRLRADRRNALKKFAVSEIEKKKKRGEKNGRAIFFQRLSARLPDLPVMIRHGLGLKKT